MFLGRDTGAGWRSLVDFFLPPACAGCGTYLPRSRTADRQGVNVEPRICPECRTRLRAPAHPRCPRCHAPRGTGVSPDRPCAECVEWPAIVRAARSAVVMRPPANALVHALKYGGWPELGQEVSEWMVGLVRGELALLGERLVVPVPTTSARLRARGYNQARILAQGVARGVGATIVDALERRPSGGSQVALQPGERRANVDGAFFLSSRLDASQAIRDQDLLLVDDVLTTGATAMAAAEALESGGARSVVVLTFARALPE